MSRIQATTLREERASIWEQMKAVSEIAATEGRDLTAEEYTKYEGLEKDLDTKRKHVERLERELELEGKLTRADVAPVGTEAVQVDNTGAAVPLSRAVTLFTQVHRSGSEAATEELRSIAQKLGAEQLAKRVRNGNNEVDQEALRLYCATDEYQDAFVSHMRSMTSEGLGLPVSDEQRAALNVGTGANGGYTVPVEFYRQLVVSERFFGVMRQLAGNIVTSDNGTVSIPKVDDANRATAVWLAEAAGFTESEDQFLQAQLSAYKSGFISKVSDELITDSAFDILGFVAQSAGEALGILANTAYVTGSSGSTTTPEGLFTKATVGFTMPTGNVTTITYNGLVELFHSVRPAYRPRGVFMGSDTIIKLLRELVDSQNRPLWQPSLVLGEPDSILGRPIYADPDVAVPAASALSLGFGDVSAAYWIRDVQGITVKILNELYAANGQVGYRIHRRTDGDVIDTLAFKTLKQSAT